METIKNIRNKWKFKKTCNIIMVLDNLKCFKYRECKYLFFYCLFQILNYILLDISFLNNKLKILQK